MKESSKQTDFHNFELFTKFTMVGRVWKFAVTTLLTTYLDVDLHDGVWIEDGSVRSERSSFGLHTAQEKKKNRTDRSVPVDACGIER